MDLLAGAPAQLTLCPQTTDRAEAIEWLETWPAVGVEGVVVKALADPYRPGQRGWRKVRHRHSVEVLVGGVTGSLDDPETVLVGRFDAAELRYEGRTYPLTPAQRRALAPLLTPPGPDHPWPVPLPPSWNAHPERSAPLEYHRVRPDVVVEIAVDTAYEYHRWRHRPTFLRVRPPDRPTR